MKTDWLNACGAALKHCVVVASGPPLEAVPLGQRLHSQSGSDWLLFLGVVEHAAGSAGVVVGLFFFVDAPSAPPGASVLP